MSLRIDHPALNKRITKKSIVNTLLGFALLLSPNSVPSIHASLLGKLGLDIWGIFFLIIGVGIWGSELSPKDNYRLTRLFLGASFGYSLIWFILLISLIVGGRQSTINLAILWGYWVWNQYEVINDDAWGTIRVIEAIRDDGNKR